MAGSNAFAFDGTAFVPSDRNLTAGISVRTSPTTRAGVARAYTMANGVPATQVWMGYPPQPSSPTYRNIRTGTAPNQSNSIWVDWTCDSSSLIASFTIYLRIGSGSYNPVGTVASNIREFNYGAISADTPYYFYVRANGVNGLNTTGGETSASLSSPGLVGSLSTSKTTTTATASWSVTAGAYQEFHVYAYTTYLGSITASDAQTTYSWTRTGLPQGAFTNFRVYGKSKDGFWSGYREANVYTNEMPVPTIYWEDTSATKYSSFRVYWSGSAGVSYQAQYSPDNSTWYNSGVAQSGTGTKYSDYLSPAYNDDYYMRVYVYDGEVSAYTNTRSVTPGRVQLTSTTPAGWGAESSSYYTVTFDSRNGNFTNGSTNGQTTTWWGDATAISVSSDGVTDRKVTSVSVTASKISGYSGSLTSDTRRVAINLNAAATRYTDFDGNSATQTLNISHSVGYQWGDNGPTATTRTLSYGIRDNISYWSSSTATWRYSSTTGSNNFWPSDRTRFVMRVNYTYRIWHSAYTTETQSQVNSTYT